MTDKQYDHIIQLLLNTFNNQQISSLSINNSKHRKPSIKIIDDIILNCVSLENDKLISKFIEYLRAYDSDRRVRLLNLKPTIIYCIIDWFNNSIISNSNVSHGDSNNLNKQRFNSITISINTIKLVIKLFIDCFIINENGSRQYENDILLQSQLDIIFNNIESIYKDILNEQQKQLLLKQKNKTKSKIFKNIILDNNNNNNNNNKDFIQRILENNYRSNEFNERLLNIINICNNNNDNNSIIDLVSPPQMNGIRSYEQNEDDDMEDLIISDDQNNELIKDWDYLFQTMIPEINLKKKKSNSDRMDIDMEIGNENKNQIDEEVSQSSQQQANGINESSMNDSQIRVEKKSLLNEEIDHVINMKNALSSSKQIQTQEFKSNINVLLNITDVESVIRLLEINEMSESILMYFLKELISLDLSYLVMSLYFNLIIYQKLQTLTSAISRDYFLCIRDCYLKHHTSFIQSVISQLFKNETPITQYQGDFINRLLKEPNTPNNIQIDLVRSLFYTLESNKTTAFNDQTILIIQTILNLKLNLDETLISQLIMILSIHTTEQSKNTKFSLLLFSIVNSYSKQCSANVPLLEKILSELNTPTTKSIIAALTKLKNTLK